jgi:hypothetical protein
VSPQGPQLQELLKLLPASASELRVELCSRFWARLTDRGKAWSDVMRALAVEEQVGKLTRGCCRPCTDLRRKVLAVHKHVAAAASGSLDDRSTIKMCWLLH